MKKLIGIFSLLIILTACVNKQGDSIIKEETNLIPGSPNLKAPENGLVCYTARPTNYDYAEIDFEWQVSPNADYYEVQIVNLLYDYSYKARSNTNKLTYSLLRGNPYAWKVVAYNANSNKFTESGTWKFYLNNDGVKNYAPFPAEILSPESGKTVAPINGKITLEWKGQDPDNNPLTYNIYLSENKDEVKNLTVAPVSTSNQKLEIEVKNSTTYYWRVQSKDQESSSYTSIFGFRTK